MRAAIYARYSTDKQRESSIDDQARVCRARAEREGWTVTAVHGDDGISGSTLVASRPAGKQLLADLLAGRFEVLLLEGLDRLSRDSVEQEQTIRRLEHRGVRVVGVSDGYDSASASRKLHRGMRGIINEVYLDDLRAKTHRGLDGQVSRGFHAGGLSYGYRSVALDDGHRLEVVPEQAEVVRWIFDRYAAGWSVQRVAHDLNRRGVPSPRGSTWAVSAIYGSPAKGSGILNNELYVGRYVWNRSQWLKDPDTRRRVRVDRPREEWRVDERPELAIVTSAQWAGVRARFAGRPKPGTRSARTLFGGLLRCGKCGGAVVAINARDYGCGAHKDRGTCGGIMVRREVTDLRLLSLIRDELLSPAAMVDFRQAVAEIAAPVDNGSQIARLEREVGNLTDAIAQAGLSPALRARLRDAEASLAGLKHEVRETRQQPTADELAALYRRAVADLRGSLGSDVEEARRVLADAFGRITLTAEGPEVWAEVQVNAQRMLMAAGVVDTGGCGGPLLQETTRLRLA